ncbi:hypothetical protein BVC80_157g8 [Macleaya cordata]|uniref:Wax synthase domain-containing protein n=1 Tax=Macleaya cordata TaxID=56857 RepID=A0A200RBY6_MACCD|nr:hypothetical protein BVC80_157g8 [Macleaya cordata]
MEDEIQNFIKVWIFVIASLIYCYFIVSKIPKGFLRLLALLPVFYIFTILPLNLYSFHLGAPTAFYLTWLGNSKLLLFSFNHGPLSSSSSSLSRSDPPKSLLFFISLACLPIKIKQNRSPKSSQNHTKPQKNKILQNPSSQNIKIKQNPSLKSSQNLGKPRNINFFKNRFFVLALKALLLALVIRIYDYREHLNPNIILALYCCHLYLGAEITLAVSGALARALLGQDLEPQFDEPYLSASLQEFWGRRWNLMVTSILRSTVYDPVRRISTPVLGKTWARLSGVFLTFVVSGLMHELLYYYMSRVDPTWEVTWFFVLHGICMILEVLVKKILTDRCQLQPWVSRPLTIGFVAVTGFWLFFPQLLRNGVDRKAISEYGLLVEFVRNKMRL